MCIKYERLQEERGLIMKKILIILGIIFAVFIALLIIVPVALKPQIVKVVKQKANESINADLNFKDIHISLLKGFPNITLSIEDLTIVNREPFQGDTLAAIGKFEATLNLMKLIFDKEAEIKSLSIVRPVIMLLALEDGSKNWDILPAKPPEAEAAPDTAAPLDLAIEKYTVSDGFLLFADEATGIYAMLDGFNHEGKGDFKKAVFTLATRTRIDTLDVRAGGIPYLNKTELEVKADLQMDMIQKRIAFQENEIRLNQLFLKFAGWVLLGDNATEIDITLSAPKTEFKSILSMIPHIYRRNFGDLKADGQLSLDGKVKGIYSKEQVPFIDLKVFVDNGNFRYPDLPAPVENFALNLQVNNPGTTLNATVIDLRRLHFEILNEPVDAQFLVKSPFLDPYIDGFVKGSVDLAQVKGLAPLGEGVDLSGLIRSDFSFRGNLSSIQKKDAGNFVANGKVSFSDIKYSSPELPAPLTVSRANIALSPQQALLQNFEMTIGESDLAASGSLDNIFGYVLAKQVLLGSLAIKSSYFDLNPFLQAEGEALQAVELPDRVEFSMAADFRKVVVTNMELTNMKGKLLLKDRKLSLIDLNAGLLDGTIVTNGIYSYVKPDKPHVDFDLKLTDLSIPGMFKTFVTVQRFAPVAGFMEGQMSGDLKLSSDLGDSLLPIWQTVSSKGALQIPNARIEGFGPLNKIADALKLEQLRDPILRGLSPSYAISDGIFNLDPATLKINDYQVIASGVNRLDKTIDYNLKFQIPAADVKANLNSTVAGLVGRDLNLLTNENIVVNVDVTGTFDKPEVKTALSEIARGAGEQLKEQARREAEEKKQELEAEARQRIQEQKTSLEDTLKKQLESQKKEAEENLKDKIKGLFGR